MNRKKITSAIAVILTALMVFSLIASVMPTMAHAIEQSDIDRIQAQKNELSGKVKDAKTRIDQLKEEQAGVLEQKIALDAENKYANEQLSLVAEEISIYEGIIKDKAEEVEEARTREEKQLQRYRARVRAMEENGGFNILSLVMNSENFSEFLTALDDMGSIMESDRELEEKYIKAREETELLKAEYEEEKAAIDEKQALLKEEQIALEKEIEASMARLEELDDEIEAAIEEYKAAEAAEAAAEASVLEMIQAYNEQKRQQEAEQAQKPQPDQDGESGGGSTDSGESGGGSTDSGESGGGDSSDGGDGGWSDSSGGGSTPSSGLTTWPVPSGNTITSRFGNRVHPISGELKFHSGIDIDGYGNDGGPIVAAGSGTVITAASNGGYGNYVIIDHGDYTQTLYAHMSGIAVSQGTYVSAGQTIGFLGQTGVATGTHCHFEVIVNGSRVDPEIYFPGNPHWNC